jgi:ubiquinone/menaquinone biosynthesis C-methylase UbiE
MVTIEFDRLAVKPGFKILDIGCGSGRHACAAYRCQGVIVIGVDLNFKELIEADDRLKLHDRLGEHGGGAWGLSAADLICLPFKDDCFDLVICSEVLEHITQYQIALKEIVRVLKSGCDLVVSVPRGWPEQICWALSREYHITRGGHVRIFKQSDLITDLENSGLKRWAVHFAHSLHTPFWWLKCLMGPNRNDSTPVKLYHRFLTWEIMKQPQCTRVLENLLNPIMGKSVVIYSRKD